MLTQEPRTTESRGAAVRRRFGGPAIALASFLAIALFTGLAWLFTSGDPDVAEEPTSTTTTVPAEPGVLDISVNDPDGKITDHAETISRLIEETHALAAPMLGIEDVPLRFTVTPDEFNAVPPDWSVGYQFADSDSLVLAVDPWFPGLDDVLDGHVPTEVGEALYDVARGLRVESGELAYGDTLLDFLVWVGLRGHFVEELPGSEAPWWDALSDAQLAEMMNEAQPLFDSTDWDSAEWCRGGYANTPLWTCFTLGYRIVETYLADNPGVTAADLVGTPASAFRPAETPEG